MFTQKDPRIITPDTTKEQKVAWLDAFRGAKLLSILIMDLQKGKLNEKIKQAYPDQKDKHPEFGVEIWSLARELYEWCEVQLPGW